MIGTQARFVIQIHIEPRWTFKDIWIWYVD